MDRSLPTPIARRALLTGAAACLVPPPGGARAQIVQFLDVPTADEVFAVLSGKPSEIQGFRSLETPRTIREEAELPTDAGAPTTGGQAAAKPRPSAARPRPASARPPAALAFSEEFPYASSELPARTAVLLDNTAEALRRDNDIRILISGHTDASGNADANVRLSLRRAESARRRLVQKHGLEPARISVLGAGATQPMPGTTPSETVNRRIQIMRVAPG